MSEDCLICGPTFIGKCPHRIKGLEVNRAKEIVDMIEHGDAEHRRWLHEHAEPIIEKELKIKDAQIAGLKKALEAIRDNPPLDSDWRKEHARWALKEFGGEK